MSSFSASQRGFDAKIHSISCVAETRLGSMHTRKGANETACAGLMPQGIAEVTHPRSFVLFLTLLLWCWKGSPEIKGERRSQLCASYVARLQGNTGLANLYNAGSISVSAWTGVLQLQFRYYSLSLQNKSKTTNVYQLYLFCAHSVKLVQVTGILFCPEFKLQQAFELNSG